MSLTASDLARSAAVKLALFCAMTKGIYMMRHIENIPIVGLDLCFTMLMRKIRDARLQAMSAMAGF